MKKTFEFIGIISLLVLSFFYTDSIKTVIKENDTLMQTIKSLDVDIEAIDAIIKGDGMIPGISGKVVDVDESYEKMKQVGFFNDSLLVYKKIKPKVSIIDNKNKYIISGNPNIRNVSLIFKIKRGDSVDEILKILDSKNIKATFFVDGYWFEDNSDKAELLLMNGHNIGNLGYNYKYDDKDLNWINTIVSKVFRQKETYCLGKENVEVCNLYKSFTIEPSVSIKNNPFITVKKELKNGSIISFENNETVLKELPLIIDYIKSKGLNIVNLEMLLEE